MRFKYRNFVIVLLVLVGLLLGGCENNSGQVSTTTAKNQFTIVTSFYPMYVSTINVARDIAGVRVINLTKPQTGCLHDYQLTPQDLITLENADVFVVNGAGMETFLEDVTARQKTMKTVEASRGIPLIKDQLGEYNAHVWVSISDAILQVKNIAGQLAAIDSANAGKYQSNADIYIAKLNALKQKMHESLDGLQNRDIITFHEAFPYFAQEFHLNIAAVIERDPGTVPSPKELAGIIGTVKLSGVKVLFTEPQYSQSAAHAIAAETGAEIYSLDPAVQGDAVMNGYDGYLDIMQTNMVTLKEALKQ